MGLIEKIKKVLDVLKKVHHNTEETRLLLGSLLAKTSKNAVSFKDSEFKVFSQFGDDGIIQFLLNNICISNDKFVEFGVENYLESNTRFLLMNNNWQGLVIDGTELNINYIKNDPIYWRYSLKAIHSFITVENINQILTAAGFTGPIGILSIDIDGNDYWVWEAITVAEADIIIVEYNSLFGYNRSITIPYNPSFSRTKAHYSNLYFGASLRALNDLGEKRGYSFVGCNQAGNNAFFVKRDKLNKIKPVSLEEGFIKARFREGRARNGELTFDDEIERSKEIVGLSVINTRTGELEKI